jgi:predicted O-linked N-acetylglucosamine transferase (SPINDLY family)
MLPCSSGPKASAPPSETVAQWKQWLQTGQTDTALTAMEQWIAEHPEADSWLTLQMAQWLLDDANDRTKAQTALHRLLSVETLPTEVEREALCLLASIHAGQGDGAKAHQLWMQVLAQDDTNSQAFAGLAALLEAQGFEAEALEAWKRAATDRAPDTRPFLRWAQSAQAQGDTLSAIEALTQATKRWPTDALLWLLLGAAQDNGGQSDLAQVTYQTAQQLAGGSQAFHRMAAGYFSGRGDVVKAVGHWVEVLAQVPGDVGATQALAQLLLAQHRPEEAIALLQQTLATATEPNTPLPPPDAASLWIQLSHAQGDLGQVGPALHSLDQAMALVPPDEQGALQLRKALTVPVIYPDTESARQGFARSEMALRTLAKFPAPIADGLTQVGATPYFLSMQAHSLRNSATYFNQALTQLPSLKLAPSGPVSAKPKVGVVSRYWQAGHWVPQLVGGVFEQLDRSSLDVVWIALGSTTAAQAGVATQPGDEWLNVPVTDEATMAHRVAACRLDGLLFADAGIEPAAYYLARHKLARHQGLLWCAPQSTGFESVNAVLSAPSLLPDRTALDEFSETALLMPEGLSAYFKRPTLPKVTLWREDFGFLPGQQVAVLGSALYKIHPCMDEALNTLLLSHPTLHLVVKEAAVRGWTNQLRERWLESLTPEAFARIRWMGALRPSDWHRLLQVADLVLDSAPTQDPGTALMALGLGTPVVALTGPLARQRWTHGLLAAMALPQWSCPDLATWHKAVGRVLQDPEAARREVEQASPLLFERTDWVQDFETLLLRWLGHPLLAT